MDFFSFFVKILVLTLKVVKEFDLSPESDLVGPALVMIVAGRNSSLLCEL